MKATGDIQYTYSEKALLQTMIKILISNLDNHITVIDQGYSKPIVMPNKQLFSSKQTIYFTEVTFSTKSTPNFGTEMG